MRFIHTADIHLGAKLLFLNDKANQQRDNIVEAFKKTIDLAISEKVDLLLIAGDLFDSNNPANATVLLAITEIKKLIAAEIYVAVIPGNHDYLGEESVYHREDFQGLKNSEYFHLFEDEAITNWHLPRIDAVIYAAAVTRKKQSKSQITEFERVTASNQIGMFHGSIDLVSSPNNFPLPQAELKKTGLDYIALGDWHGQLEVSKANPAIYYSGSPEIIASDQALAGSILLIETASGKVDVKPVNVGKLSIEQLSLDISEIKSSADLVEVVQRKVSLSKEKILNLKLQGSLSLNSGIDVIAIKEQLSDQSFFVNISDETVFAISEADIKKYGKHFIVANFIEYIESQKKDNPEDKDLYDAALQEGVRLLISKHKTNESD